MTTINTDGNEINTNWLNESNNILSYFYMTWIEWTFDEHFLCSLNPLWPGFFFHKFSRYSLR